MHIRRSRNLFFVNLIFITQLGAMTKPLWEWNNNHSPEIKFLNYTLEDGAFKEMFKEIEAFGIVWANTYPKKQVYHPYPTYETELEKKRHNYLPVPNYKAIQKTKQKAENKINTNDLYAYEEEMLARLQTTNFSLSEANTLCIKAIECNLVKVIDLLVKKYSINIADLDYQHPVICTALHPYFTYTDPEGVTATIQYLFQHKARPFHRSSNNESPLELSISLDLPPITTMLLDNGANIDDTDNEGNTALFRALRNVQFPLAYTLVKLGANVNQITRKKTLLNKAITEINGYCTVGDEFYKTYLDSDGHIRLPGLPVSVSQVAVAFLLALGADPNLPNSSDRNRYESIGFIADDTAPETPFYVACKEGRSELLPLLYKHGAKINQGNIHYRKIEEAIRKLENPADN